MTDDRFLLPTTGDDLTGTPVGLALLGGKVRATLTSKKSGQHITLHMTAKARGAGARQTSFDMADVVYIDVPNAGGGRNDEVGRFHPAESGVREAGWFVAGRFADPTRVWAARRVLLIARGDKPMEDDLCKVQLGVNCLRCFAELDDDDSIARGFGPDCWGIVTGQAAKSGSTHQRRAARTFGAQVPVPEPATTPSPFAATRPGESMAEFVARVTAAVE